MPCWGRKTAAWVRTSSMLYVLSMLFNQCWREFLEDFSQLRNDLGFDKILDRLLLFRFRINIYIELEPVRLSEQLSVI